jgi:CheY-like chemotaxis protein
VADLYGPFFELLQNIYIFSSCTMNEPGYILIAEDDEDDQLLLISAFKEVAANARLIFVENGIELIRYFARFEEGLVRELPLLLVVDLNMPKKNGREAITEIMQKDYFRKFPTVIFSTTGNELEKNRCRALGVDEFFVKPSNYSNLLNIVSQFIELAGIAKGF